MLLKELIPLCQERQASSKNVLQFLTIHLKGLELGGEHSPKDTWKNKQSEVKSHELFTRELSTKGGRGKEKT